jgi:hypothetical protein
VLAIWLAIERGADFGSTARCVLLRPSLSRSLKIIVPSYESNLLVAEHYTWGQGATVFRIRDTKRLRQIHALICHRSGWKISNILCASKHMVWKGT